MPEKKTASIEFGGQEFTVSTWATFDEVYGEFCLAPYAYAGIGFVFSADDPYCGIDLIQ